MKLIIDVPQMDRRPEEHPGSSVSGELGMARCGRTRASRAFGPPHQRGGGHGAAHGAGRTRRVSEPRPAALTHERAGVTRRGADGELRAMRLMQTGSSTRAAVPGSGVTGRPGVGEAHWRRG